MDVIDELIAYCEAWEPWARVMGNVCAGDAAQALRSLRAENAELQHELTKGIHTCGPTCRKTPRCAEMADLRAELAACSAVIEAARCIRHWHDAPNEGMVVSGSHVRELWKALNNYDAARRGEGEA